MMVKMVMVFMVLVMMMVENDGEDDADNKKPVGNHWFLRLPGFAH